MVLDYNKLDNAYKNLGISIEDNDETEERNGIKVLGIMKMQKYFQ